MNRKPKNAAQVVPILDTLEVQLTAECNLKCSYCGNDPVLRSHFHNWLPFDSFKKCVDALHPKNVLLTGGEATMAWPRLVECFKYTKEKGINNILSSNMTRIGEDEIDFLIDECGVSRFHSSFNDYSMEMSEAVRGSGPAERHRIINNFSYIANERKIPLRVETLILKETAACVLNTYKAKHGNIHKESPRAIWESNEIFKRLRAEKPEACSTCSHWYSDSCLSCNNGCWALLLMETGEMKESCGHYVRDKVRELNHSKCRA